MAEITFRDFAGAVMQNDVAAAGKTLEVLLGLDAAAAGAAARHFATQMDQAGPAFMMKAMGLRSAVAGGDDAQIQGLLGECFGLTGDAGARAVAALRGRYGG